jgi:NADH-quinone oxidoreductase subunit L
LLVSPSVVSYLIRARLYQNKEEKESRINKLPKKLVSTLYILALKEFNLDALVNKLVFSPLKRIGYKFNFLTTRNLLFYVIPAFFLGCYLLFNEALIHPYIKAHLPNFFSLIGLIMVLKAFGERKSPRLAWSLLILNNFWIALAVSFNEHFNKIHLVIYLSGVVVAGVVGYICLRKLKKLEPKFYSLNKYYGHVYEHKKLAFVFLLACMGLMGFPITPTFIGEDLIFSHIHEEQIFLAFFNALGFIVGGIAVIRIYARLFMGTHCKSYHPTPLKSS